MKKTFTTLGSVIVGFLSFALLGWSIGNLVEFLTKDIVSFPATYITYGFIIVFSLIGIFSGIKKPIFTELFAYGISIMLIIQFLWDFGVLDVSSRRWTIFSISILTLIINIFSGKVKLWGAKKTALNIVGVGK